MEFEQLSLFDSIAHDKAISCWDDTELPISAPEEWMLRVVPAATYVAELGGHLMVLKPTRLKKETVPQGHQYYHYQVGEKVFAGTFIN